MSIASPQSSDAPAGLPLAGVLVVDATTDLAGQLCGRLLMDAGATVVRVPLKERVPRASWDQFLNLGKIELPVAEVQSIVGRAHVLLCTRPEIDYPDLDLPVTASRNTDVMLVRVPPFGSGPYEAFRSNDAILSALSGLADCTPGYPDRQEGESQPPIQALAPLAEFGAALTAAVATVGGLLQRFRSSAGPMDVEVSQLEAAVALMIFDWGAASYGGVAPGRRRKARMLEPNCYLPSKDGYAVIVATSDKHWQALVDAMGSPSWALEDRFASVTGRAEHVDDLHALLREWAAAHSARDLMVKVQAQGVPCAASLELADALRSEQVRVLGSLEAADGQTFPADAIALNGKRRLGRYAGSKPGPSQAPLRGGTTPIPLPLSGMRILDCSQLVAGPMAGQLLRALGAEVLIVESRRRPTPRMYGPFATKPEHDASANFNHVNRGKRSVELDLKTAEGQMLLKELVRRSDVVIENYSKRAAENLGLTFPQLQAVRPGIVLASISAFGRVGPWGSYVANHAGVTALTGLGSVIRDPEGRPRLVGALMPDVLTGTYAALAILQALISRMSTGAGALIEISMLDVMLNSMGGLLPAAARGEALENHPVRFFETSEPGKYLAVDDAACPGDLRESSRTMSRVEAMSKLQSEGIRAGAVLDLLEVIGDPHLHARGFVNHIDHPVVGPRPLPGVPWVYDGKRPDLGVAPVLGSDTESVMRQLGISPAEISRLREGGVLR